MRRFLGFARRNPVTVALTVFLIAAFFSVSAFAASLASLSIPTPPTTPPIFPASEYGGGGGGGD